MQVNVQVDSSTLSHQFVALSNLFRELSGVPEADRVQPAAAVETAVVVQEGTVVETEQPAQTTTRRRRTKAEIEAESAQKALEAENAASSQVVVAQEPVVVDEFEKVADTVVTGNKTYTEAEAQHLATAIARTKGPQVVKDKIAELGATRIGDLTADQLNELGNFLEAQK